MQITLDSPEALERIARIPIAFWPARRPSWLDPPLWSSPLTLTAIVPVPGNGDWTPVLTTSYITGYLSVISRYVLTAFAPNAGANCNIRILINGRLFSSVQLVGSAEYNRLTPATFPTYGRRAFNFSIARPGESLQFQVQNNGPLQQLILAAMYGWNANILDDAERADSQGMMDVS